MYERRHEPLLPHPHFIRRVARSAGFAAVLILGSLGIGIVGYHGLCGLPWLDALLNASMILGGMGPVDAMRGTGCKWFGSGYALFSGIMLLGSVGVLAAPVLHRFMHHFHLEEEGRSRR